ncbi:hypothetical protein TNCT_200221 [Trichonephila clavata]|uniref:Uncharacterized protein n=1 Tax=Trichonephila clavata TaxID=2740835 RepID=A0A8X6LNS1_TRICU|nr:hypothetical protein TNCT_200221 [Trichonephila clavata]
MSWCANLYTEQKDGAKMGISINLYPSPFEAPARFDNINIGLKWHLRGSSNQPIGQDGRHVTPVWTGTPLGRCLLASTPIDADRIPQSND